MARRQTQTPAGVKTRTSYNDTQRQALRTYAFTHRATTGTLPSHANLSQWWASNYGSGLCQSVISTILSPKYAYLDTTSTPLRPGLARFRPCAWPQLEAALWEWQMHTEAQNGNAVSGQMLKSRAAELWGSMSVYAGKEVPSFSEGWLLGYRQRHGTHTPRKDAVQNRAQTMTSWLMERVAEGFRAATQCVFLRAAGEGAVGKEVLSQWVSQDRLYAQGYIRFVGQMLAKMRLPNTAGTGTLQWRVTDILISGLTNVRRELGFFEDVGKRYELDLETPWQGEDTFGPTPTTKSYLDMFINASSAGTSLLEGMVALWATEKCYYAAWLYALHCTPKQPHRRPNPGDQEPIDPLLSDADGGALRKEFIPNWTSDDFGNFVHQIGALVNELADVEKGKGMLEEEKKRCEEIWKQVLWLEERFWPVLEERDAIGDIDDMELAPVALWNGEG